MGSVFKFYSLLWKRQFTRQLSLGFQLSVAKALEHMCPIVVHFGVRQLLEL